MDFSFNESKNVAVITCCHILEDNDAICYVTHDEEDGCWQFLCGKDHDESEVRIVSLEEIFEKDPTIGMLSDMPLGCGATRENRESPWKGFRQ
jgi:hypothetical protein